MTLLQIKANILTVFITARSLKFHLKEAEMFAATVGMEPLGEFTTFSEAFEAFYREIMTLLGQKALCWQTLETTCWIEHPVKLITRTVTIPMMFYEARDLAANLGLTQDGKLVQPLPIVNSETVEKFFLSAALELALHKKKGVMKMGFREDVVDSFSYVIGEKIIPGIIVVIIICVALVALVLSQ